MKKIVYQVIVVLCGLFASLEAGAQTAGSAQARESVARDQFYPVEVADMPRLLREAVNQSYTGWLVKSVEVSNNSTFVKYKVVLADKNGKMYKVYFDDRGHVLEEHPHFE